MSRDDFDLRVLSLGAGKQSSVLYLGAVEGMFGDPAGMIAIFANTMNERSATYAWLDELEQIGGTVIPILRPSAGNLKEDALRSMRESPSRFLPIPAYCVSGQREGMGRRQCTRSHKLEVIHQEVRRQLGLKRGEVGKGRFRVEVWIGISLDESHRARPSRYPILGYRWPLLIEQPMTRADCIRWLEERGHDKVVPSSCWHCPFKNDRDWMELRANDPAAWEEAVAFDREINVEGHYLHVSLKPLGEVELSGGRQIEMFVGCEGMCGV